jgi:nitrate reductase alpha subunit
MSKMKSMIRMAAMMTALAYGGNSWTTPGYYEPKETEEERKVRFAKAERKRYKAQGLTEFFYGENSLWALNKKSADRKARRRHWL